MAKVRSVFLKARLLPLLPVPEQLNVPGSSIVWSAAKIFENVLCFLDVPATDHSLLVTRTYFPWTKDPTSLPARVAAYRTTPHPAAPGSLGLAASSVRSQALQSTPATRGRDAPENHCGLNNETVLASQEATHGTLKKILRWALHRGNILIDVDMARDLEDPQHRTHRIQVDVAKQLVWWARQVQPIVGRKWESAYRHVVRTDTVPADSSLPVALSSTEVLWERVRVVGAEAGPLVDIVSLADQRRLTVPLKSVQAGKKITWVKRAPPQEWSGQDFTSRGARGFFPVDFKEAFEVVKAAGVELGMLRIQHSERQQRSNDRVADVARIFCGAVDDFNSLDEQQRAVLFRQLRTSGPVLTEIADGASARRPSTSSPAPSREEPRWTNYALHPVRMSEVNKTCVVALVALVVVVVVDVDVVVVGTCTRARTHLRACIPSRARAYTPEGNHCTHGALLRSCVGTAKAHLVCSCHTFLT